MKLINLIFVLFIIGCTKKQNEINKEKFGLFIKNDRAIILSCFKCDCITSFFSSPNKSLKDIESIDIYADSNCYENKIDIKYIHLSQDKIDSIFLKNYNAILIKRNKGGIEYKILKTEESSKFSASILDFFKK